MKVKNIFLSVVLSASLFVTAFTLSSCGNNKPKEEQYKIYELAKESGYTGTYDEWLASIKGADGKNGREIELSIEDNKIVWRYVGENNWKLIYSIDDLIGPKGDQGDSGKDGISISKIEKTSSEELMDTYTITYSDGTTSTFIVTNGKDGVDGEQGIQGVPGKDGTTPNVSINEEGYWVINDVATQIKATGIKGDAGENGKSAYELYLDTHPEYQGDVEKWLDDLVNGQLASKEKIYYNVKFITDSETVIPDQQVERFYTINEPKVPEKEGYEFDGWYHNDKKWDIDTKIVIDDVTLRAKWKEITFKVVIKDGLHYKDSFVFSRSAISNNYYVKNISNLDTYNNALTFFKNNKPINVDIAPGDNNIYEVKGEMNSYYVKEEVKNATIRLSKTADDRYEVWVSSSGPNSRPIFTSIENFTSEESPSNSSSIIPNPTDSNVKMYLGNQLINLAKSESEITNPDIAEEYYALDLNVKRNETIEFQVDGRDITRKVLVDSSQINNIKNSDGYLFIRSSSISSIYLRKFKNGTFNVYVSNYVKPENSNELYVRIDDGEFLEFVHRPGRYILENIDVKSGQKLTFKYGLVFPLLEVTNNYNNVDENLCIINSGTVNIYVDDTSLSLYVTGNEYPSIPPEIKTFKVMQGENELPYTTVEPENSDKFVAVVNLEKGKSIRVLGDDNALLLPELYSNIFVPEKSGEYIIYVNAINEVYIRDYFVYGTNITQTLPETINLLEKKNVSIKVENTCNGGCNDFLYIKFDDANIYRSVVLENFKIDGEQVEYVEIYEGEKFIGYKVFISLPPYESINITADIKATEQGTYKITSSIKETKTNTSTIIVYSDSATAK